MSRLSLPAKWVTYNAELATSKFQVSAEYLAIPVPTLSGWMDRIIGADAPSCR